MNKIQQTIKDMLIKIYGNEYDTAESNAFDIMEALEKIDAFNEKEINRLKSELNTIDKSLDKLCEASKMIERV